MQKHNDMLQKKRDVFSKNRLFLLFISLFWGFYITSCTLSSHTVLPTPP